MLVQGDFVKLKHGFVIRIRRTIFAFSVVFLIASCQSLDLYYDCHAMYKNCDANLDTATESLYRLSNQLDSCSKSNKDLISRKSEAQKLIFVCGSYDEEICNVVDLKVKSNETFLHSVENQESEELTTEHMQILNVMGQQTFFLPLNISRNFVNLQQLIVTSSGLYEIDSDVFKDMESLVTLKLSNNKLHEVFSETFVHLLSLTSLDLKSNKIEVLHQNAFGGLVVLKILDLSDNFLVSTNSNAFEDLSSLRELNLQNNKIKFISDDLLSPMTKLESLDLTDNVCISTNYPDESWGEILSKIAGSCVWPIDIKCNFFQQVVENYSDMGDESLNMYMCSAESLSIQYPKTRLSKIKGDHRPNLDINDVEVFSVTGQSMKFFPFQLSKFLPKLQVISIEKSQLSGLQANDFSGFEDLNEITIKENNLTLIEAGAFDGLVKLEYLDLSHNNIRSLPPKIFFNLFHLKTLILSNNLIKQLNIGLVGRKNVVVEFRADNNQLEIMESKMLRYLRKANVIDLSKNVCIDMTYNSSDTNGKSFADLYTEIDISCSPDE